VTLRDWLVPPTDPEWTLPHAGTIALVVGAVLVTLVVLGARAARTDARTASATPWRVLRACALLLSCYMGMIAVSRLVADPAIPLDERILAPFLLLVVTAMTVALACWWRSGASLAARTAVAAGLVAWWIASASVARDDARFALGYGSDFAGAQWRSSPVLQWARTDGAAHPLYTNWPAAVYFHLHRTSYALPERGEEHTLGAFADTLRRRDGRVLLFTAPNADDIVADSIVAVRGLRVVARFGDGVVLAPDPIR
jgi:hypothetical protein